jgi:hypothetical protein
MRIFVLSQWFSTIFSTLILAFGHIHDTFYEIERAVHWLIIPNDTHVDEDMWIGKHAFNGKRQNWGAVRGCHSGEAYLLEVLGASQEQGYSRAWLREIRT